MRAQASPKQVSNEGAPSQGILTCRDTSSLFNISGDSGTTPLGLDSHRSKLRTGRSSFGTIAGGGNNPQPSQRINSKTAREVVPLHSTKLSHEESKTPNKQPSDRMLTDLIEGTPSEAKLSDVMLAESVSTTR
jgi:hypothetical protein